MASDERHPTDGECVAAVLSGEAERFSALVERYQCPLLAAARSRLGSRELAEEAVQETFLCAFRWLDSYDSRYSFRTWLWTILLNQCRRRYAKLQKSLPIEPAADGRLREQVTDERSPPQRLLAKEQAERLSHLLAELPEPQADALRLRFFGGLKFQEIADCVGCSLSGAKNRVRLGLEKMSAILREEEAASAAGGTETELSDHKTSRVPRTIPGDAP